MKRFLTVEEAKKEINHLKLFVRLVEGYEANTLEQKILKAYAYSGTIKGAAELINNEFKKSGLPLIESSYITEVIRKRPSDPLHRIVRTAYLTKTRHSRSKCYR